MNLVYGTTTRSALLLAGYDERSIDRRVRSGEWERLRFGVYRIEQSIDPYECWLGLLYAHTAKRGVISHRSAACLHHLDGFDWRNHSQVDVTIQPNESRSSDGNGRIFRSAIAPADIVSQFGIRTTSVLRTLCDLARLVDADLLEIALESALRGARRWEPHIWNDAILLGLRNDATLHRRAGSACLRTVLDRRSDSDRPTGSYPETLLLQALRRLGIEVMRQPDVNLFVRGQHHRYFPDFAVFARGLLIEVDSMIGHSAPKQLERDNLRQNELSEVFDIVRFPASQIIRDPDGVAHSIRNRIVHRPLVDLDRIQHPFRLTMTPSGVIVADRR